jgi:predicted permease
MTNWSQDLRLGLRALARAPGLVIPAVLVLGLGIGANSAMFTLVDAMLFKPLSGRTGQLVGVYCGDRTRNDRFHAFSYPNYSDVRDRSGLFDGLLAHAFSRVGTASTDGVRPTFAEFVSSNYFDVLGTRLAAGRAFLPGEEKPGARVPVVIVSYSRWKAANLSPSFLGTTIRLSGQDLTVVGVTPEGFTGTMAFIASEVYLPLGMFDAMAAGPITNAGAGLADRGRSALLVAGIGSRGLAATLIDQRLAAVARALETAYPAENKDLGLVAGPLPRMGTSTSPQSDTGLDLFAGFLLALSGIVLVIACLNVATVLMARSEARRLEFALRVALGAGRARIVEQVLIESLALSTAGTAVGLFVGFAVMKALAVSLAAVLPVPVLFSPIPDAGVLAASVGAAVFSTVLVGLGPAWRLSRRDLVTGLKQGRGTGGRRGRIGAGNALVVGQIALALVLLTAGGIFARTAVEASVGDPGYRYDRLLLASVDTRLGAYDENRGRAALGRVLERVRVLPAVESASVTSSLPFGDSHEGRAVESLGSAGRQSGGEAKCYRAIGSDYFATAGLRVVRGREFTPSEELAPAGPRPAIIDAILARRLFGADEPLGQTIRILPEPGDAPRPPDEPLQVVGIAPPLRDGLLDRGPVSHLYVPFGRYYEPRFHVQVRLRQGVDEAGALAALRQAIRSTDADLPIVAVSTMRGFHENGLDLWGLRAAGRLFTALGVLALVLASVGVFGLTSYLVAQRTVEFGVRMALGANRRDVMLLVARDGARLTGVAVALGVPLAALVSIAFTKVFVEVGGFDPFTIAAAATALALASIVASLVPGRRAARVAPIVALRSE